MSGYSVATADAELSLAEQQAVLLLELALLLEQSVEQGGHGEAMAENARAWQTIDRLRPHSLPAWSDEIADGLRQAAAFVRGIPPAGRHHGKTAQGLAVLNRCMAELILEDTECGWLGGIYALAEEVETYRPAPDMVPRLLAHLENQAACLGRFRH